MRRLSFLHRLEWTLYTEPIPLSRHFLTEEDEKRTRSTEDEDTVTVTIADLQLFVRRCIPQVNVQLKLSHV